MAATLRKTGEDAIAKAPQRDRYDVAVVGAGVIGLACAWRAVQRGLSVVVLERDAPGAGASGVAAGMLAPVTEASFGEEALLGANLESAQLWPAFAAELAEASGFDPGFGASGALAVAVDRDDAEELRRLHEFQRSLGLDSRWLTRRECRELEPGLAPGIAGGILAPQDHRVEPRRLVAALARALERDGGELRAGVAVDSVEDGGVRIGGGELVGAENVVVAAGAWSGLIAGPAPTPPLRPVKGQLLELRTPAGAAPLAERLIRTPRCYVVHRGDGKVVVGATVEERGFDSAVTADGVFRLLEAAREVLPDTGELELEAARAGLRPGTPDNRPLIGRDDSLIWATGHHRNGMLLAPWTARAVADLLDGGQPPESLRAFDPGRFAAAPQPAGSPA